MKICFAFLITDILNNELLWYNFFKDVPNIEIVVHCSNSNQLKYINKLTDNIFINEVETKWGRLLKVENFLLQKSKDLNCDKCIFLSNSCLPIKNINYIFEKINNNLSFISNCEMWNGVESRFPKKLEFTYLVNQQWIIIDKRHYDLFLFDEYRDYFENDVVLPEESYHSTIMQKLNLNNNENLLNTKTTFTDWTRSTNNGNSPYVFGNNDSDVELINQIKDDEYLFFIRKVSDNLNSLVVKKILKILKYDIE